MKFLPVQSMTSEAVQRQPLGHSEIVAAGDCNRVFHIIKDPMWLKFIYSEKATKLCEISTLFLSVCIVVKSKMEIFAEFCDLLRIYEL